MLEMTDYIRAAFKGDILDNLDWMDAETKARARLKLDRMEQSIGYSEEFTDRAMVDGFHAGIEIGEDNYFENSVALVKFWRVLGYKLLRETIEPKSWLQHKFVAVANAFYTPSQNFMEFPAGILQGVFFHLNAPMYLNFGAIGTIIGHELTHGFDDQGKQRNEDGLLHHFVNVSCVVIVCH